MPLNGIISLPPNLFVEEMIGRKLTVKMSDIGKLKLSLCLNKHYAMKSFWGSGGTASSILTLGTRWR
jgi:hypothetical protein